VRDDQKSKQQLIEELAALRRMTADVERLRSEYKGAERALAEEKRISDTMIESLPGIYYLFDEGQVSPLEPEAQATADKKSPRSSL
jgi:hypothetical protein